MHQTTNYFQQLSVFDGGESLTARLKTGCQVFSANQVSFISIVVLSRWAVSKPYYFTSSVRQIERCSFHILTHAKQNSMNAKIKYPPKSKSYNTNKYRQEIRNKSTHTKTHRSSMFDSIHMHVSNHPDARQQWIV